MVSHLCLNYFSLFLLLNGDDTDWIKTVIDKHGQECKFDFNCLNRRPRVY